MTQLSDTKLNFIEDSAKYKSVVNMGKDKIKKLAKREGSAISTFSAVILALVLGLIIRGQTEKWSERSLMYLSFPGEIFLQMLKCLILPLIISTLISSFGSLNSKLSVRIGIRALLYYLTTTVFSVFLGMVLVSTIRPGTKNVETSGFKVRTITTDIILDMIRNLFPKNLIEACFAQYSTKLIPRNNETDIYNWKIQGGYENSGSNILGLVFFSIVLGTVISIMKSEGNEGKPLFDLFNSLSEITLKISNIVIKLIPIGVMFLVLSKIISVSDMSVLFNNMGLFAFTVIIGLLIHGLICLPAIYYVLTRKNPYTFLAKMSEALIAAFGTASSLATLPITMSCLENKTNLNKKIVRICVPIGVTINMNGTALYETVAAIFLAQSTGVEMNFAKVVLICITATIASLGTAGIPQAGLITMILVLNAIGVSAEHLAIIITIDWILDRFRTTINVLGDAYGSGIVDHLSRNELEEFDDN